MESDHNREREDGIAAVMDVLVEGMLRRGVFFLVDQQRRLCPQTTSAWTKDPTQFSAILTAKFHLNAISKFTDDATIVGQISNNDKSEYRKEMECFVSWCKDNKLSLNVSKTEELIIDFRKKGGGRTPIYINGAKVKRFETIKILKAANIKDGQRCQELQMLEFRVNTLWSWRNTA
eukprot:g25081.t1